MLVRVFVRSGGRGKEARASGGVFRCVRVARYFCMSDNVIGTCTDCVAPATLEPEGRLLCETCAKKPCYRAMWSRIVNKLHDMELEMRIEKLFEAP
jgi:hypothetical protein